MSDKIKVIILKGAGETIEVPATHFKSILAYLGSVKTPEFMDELLTTKHSYILAKENDFENMIPVLPEVLLSDFKGWDILFIAPEVSGEEPISLGVMAAGAMGLTTAGAVSVTAASLTVMGSIVAYAVTAVVMIGVSLAINMVMSMLSPTPEFSTEPASKQQQSNLFNGAPIIRNQGGSVPLIFGQPYSGAVLISSGLFSEEVTL